MFLVVEITSGIDGSAGRCTAGAGAVPSGSRMASGGAPCRGSAPTTVAAGVDEGYDEHEQSASGRAPDAVDGALEHQEAEVHLIIESAVAPKRKRGRPKKSENASAKPRTNSKAKEDKHKQRRVEQPTTTAANARVQVVTPPRTDQSGHFVDPHDSAQ